VQKRSRQPAAKRQREGAVGFVKLGSTRVPKYFPGHGWHKGAGTHAANERFRDTATPVCEPHLNMEINAATTQRP